MRWAAFSGRKMPNRWFSLLVAIIKLNNRISLFMWQMKIINQARKQRKNVPDHLQHTAGSEDWIRDAGWCVGDSDGQGKRINGNIFYNSYFKFSYLLEHKT